MRTENDQATELVSGTRRAIPAVKIFEYNWSLTDGRIAAMYGSAFGHWCQVNEIPRHTVDEGAFTVEPWVAYFYTRSRKYAPFTAPVTVAHEMATACVREFMGRSDFETVAPAINAAIIGGAADVVEELLT